MADPNKLRDFYVLDHEVIHPIGGMNSTCKLCQSADFSHMQLQFDFKVANEFTCTVILEGTVVGNGIGNSRPAAKNEACTVALDELSQTNWTVIRRKRDKPRPDPNKLTNIIGHALKESDRPQFMSRFHNYLAEVLENIEDLTMPIPLSHELNRIERDCIHTVASEMDVKVLRKRLDGARGDPRGNDPMFLVLCKNLSSHDLFEYIWNKGGETWKFRLKPPGNLNIPAEKLFRYANSASS